MARFAKDFVRENMIMSIPHPMIIGDSANDEIVEQMIPQSSEMIIDQVDQKDRIYWAKFFAQNFENKIEPYSSMIPPAIRGRSSDVLENLTLLRVERIDLPKMPNGSSIIWWYIVQMKTCFSCVFLSAVRKSFPERICQNPKISEKKFEIHYHNQSVCSEWFAGFDSSRISQENSFGFDENKYVYAAFVALGLIDDSGEHVNPAIGSAELFYFSPDIAQAADIHNSMVFYYLQTYYLEQAGHVIDKENVEYDMEKALPVINAEPFDLGSITSKGIKI